ncbi:polyphenol oxidase family protein [Roseibacillus ishigakijimensis]|uniref:polyphenol oxidase family protein n=1 Tax=Roseibacillus ishigakijimensis TaxID=454146 RepID=UPI00366A77FD
MAASFVPRVAEVAGSYDKEEVLGELEPFHRQEVAALGYDWSDLWRAEQVHGVEVARVPAREASRIIPGCDGLLSNCPGTLLGIYVADCGVIWVADPVKQAIALLHSGRKGSEGGILPRAIEAMGREFGSQPADLMVVLGPCIRPPHYEVDIAQLIAMQAEECGVGSFEDCGLCTGSDLASNYSYRMEKGRTGRMLGLLGLPAKSSHLSLQ